MFTVCAIALCMTEPGPDIVDLTALALCPGWFARDVAKLEELAELGMAHARPVTLELNMHAERDEAWWWPVGAGACFGLALLCRIDSAALAATVALAGWITLGYRLRIITLGLVGAAPLLAEFGAYNWLVTGSPMLPPTMYGCRVRRYMPKATIHRDRPIASPSN